MCVLYGTCSLLCASRQIERSVGRSSSAAHLLMRSFLSTRPQAGRCHDTDMHTSTDTRTRDVGRRETDGMTDGHIDVDCHARVVGASCCRLGMDV